LQRIAASGQPYEARSFALFTIASLALPSFSSRAAALSPASRSALRHSSGRAGSLRPRLPISGPRVTPAENTSTISGLRQPTLRRPSASGFRSFLPARAFISCEAASLCHSQPSLTHSLSECLHAFRQPRPALPTFRSSSEVDLACPPLLTTLSTTDALTLRTWRSR